jgi:hypothetical protein
MSKRQTRVFLTGGLGNQLFQYAVALSRNTQELQIDCLLGNPRTNGLGIPDIFDFHFPLITKQYKSFLPKYLFSKTAGYLLRQGMQPTQLEKNLIFKKLVKLFGTAALSIWLNGYFKILQATDNGYWKMPTPYSREYLIGYFQSYVWAEEPRVKAQLQSMRLVNPSQELSDFLESEKKFRATAVHIRLGDYKLEDGLGIPTFEYYAEALNEIENINPIERIWLFSNEPEEAVSFLPAKYKKLTIVVPNFMGSAAETLEAMRHSVNYVIANSSMSWWGAFLSYSESPIVIAPKPWFKSNQEPTKIVPQNWIRLVAWTNQT